MDRFNRAVAAVRGRVMGELFMTGPAVLVARYRHWLPRSEWTAQQNEKARLMAENLLLRLRLDAFTKKDAWAALREVAPEHLPPKPTFKGAPSKLGRNVAILDAVFETSVIFKLNPTRYRERGGGPLPYCCEQGGSACDAVGVALADADYPRMAYRTIETVWTNRPSYIPHPSIFYG